MKEKYRDYIKSLQHWKDMFSKIAGWRSEDKVTIKKIKIDRNLFSFNNPLRMEDVHYMLVNFNKNAWMPITVNEDYYLLDGQHRLELAKQLGLNYIDVLIDNENEIEYCKEPSKLKSMTAEELMDL